MKKMYIMFACLAFATALYSAKDNFQTREHWSTGYYRASSEQHVYFYNDETRWYCHVQNATQLNSFSAQDQVRVVGNIYPILNLGVSLSECPWWDGFYKTDESETVYRLYPGNVCEVTSPEMLAAYGATDVVVTAEVGSDFTAHRTNVGQCYWPY